MTMIAPEPAVRPIPEGFHTITPSLTVHAAAEAIEFYTRAFGAVEIDRAVGPDGQKVMHATIQIGSSRLMLNDEFPEMQCFSPRTVGGAPSSMFLYVEDADSVYARAVAAGATATVPLSDAFWGDRFGCVTDPYGYTWSIATRQRTVSIEEAQRAMAEMGGCSPEAGQGS